MKRMKQLGMLWFAAVICLTAMMALPRSASALTDAEQIVGVQVAPVDVPLGEAVVPQDLSDALSAQTGDGCALDMEKLRELFDVDADVDALHVQAAGWRGEYSAAPSTTGAFEIDARSRYILIELIESERKMVQWAGVVAPGEAPRSLFSCSMQAPSDDALEIDISKVVEAYGDVELQIADEGKAYALCPTDDGVARIAMKGKPKYVFIRREADGRQPYLWAARFDEPVRCALEPAGEVEPDASALSWSISIGEMDARRIPLTFDAGNGALPLPWAQVRLTYVDAAGEVLREEQISATEFSSIGSYTHEPQMPKGTSSVRASVYLDGEAVCEAEAGLSLPAPDPALNAPQPSGETGRPKPEPSPTPAIVLEMEATATPEPAVELRIADNPAVAYDGKAHAPEIEVRTARAQAAYSYAPVGAGGALPAQGDWQSGLPEATEAGTHEWWIRAEAKGREIEYQDAKGEKLNARSGCVRVKLEILPAELQIELSAEQIGQAVYDGREQTLRFRYDASVKRDESGCFDLQTVLDDPRWRKEGELVRTDAGEYPVEPEAGTVEFLDALRDGLSPNYKAEWAWKPSNVQLLKKPVALTSDSAATVYGAEDWPLKAGGVEGLDGFVEGDLYNSDVVAIGEQSAAGVGENGIWVNEDLQHNYRLEIRPGALVVFPQSLDGDAPEWNAQDGAARAREWSEASPEEMPGYYLGMRVELERSRAPYDGAPKQILPRFSDANGAPIHLEMEKDYSLRFLRNGVETDDLTNAGELAV